MAAVLFTHKGWFGLCPCYFADVEAESPSVIPRWWFLDPLLFLSNLGFAIWETIRVLSNPTARPSFPLIFTGQLSPPLVRRVVVSR